MQLLAGSELTDQLVTSNSMNLFHILKLSAEYLSADPNIWELKETTVWGDVV